MVRVRRLRVVEDFDAKAVSFHHVSAALRKIHDARGELQNVTLQHIFEMRAVLTPRNTTSSSS